MANVLTKSVPRLDPTDVEGSFVKIFDYLYNSLDEYDLIYINLMNGKE